MTSSSDLQPDSKQFRAFTVMNGWHSEQAAAVSQELFETQPFTFEESPWAIVWEAGEGGMSVSLKDMEAQETTPPEEVLEIEHVGQGIRYVDRVGTFCLTVKCRGDWVVKVVEVA